MNFSYDCNDYFKPLIQEGHDATLHLRIEKTLKYLIHSYHWQSLVAQVMEFVNSCNTCQHTKYWNKEPLAFRTRENIPTVPLSGIRIDFLQLFCMFITYCELDRNIRIEADHILCISHIWTIVDRFCACKFLVPVADNLKAQTGTAPDDIQGYPGSIYCNTIEFHHETSFMLCQFE